MLVSRQIVRTLRTSRSLHVQCRYLLSQSLDSVSLSRAIQRPSDVLTKSVTAFHTTSRVENEHIINIQDEADFKDRVINNEKPVVVDFHAVWCGPCKMLGPRLEAMVSKRDDFLLAKVDIDDNSDLAIEHGVEAVPTVLAMKNGKIVDKFVGLKDDDGLANFVNKLTGK